MVRPTGRCGILAAIDHALQKLFSRRHRVVAALVVLLLGPFLLGPYGYVNRYEAEHTIPFAEYFLTHPGNGTFVHGIGGGNDRSAFGTGIEGISIYKLARLLLPGWLALLAEKAVLVFASWGGAFLLLARFVGLSAPQAGLLSLIFLVLQSPYDEQFRYGYHIMPLIGLICCTRWRDRGFLAPPHLAGAIAACVYAGLANPVHNLPNVAAAAVFVPIMVGRFSIARSLVAIAIMTVVAVADWAEALFAWFQLSTFSNRLAASPSYTLLEGVFSLYLTSRHDWFTLCGMGALGIGLVVRSPGLGAFCVGLAAFIGSYSLLMAVPWSAWHLGFVPDVASHALGFVRCAALIAIALAVRGLGSLDGSRAGSWLPSLATTLLLTTALVLMGRLQLGTARTLIHDWNQSYASDIANLARPDWRASAPYRAVSVNGSVPIINILGAQYGIDTFGGIINLKNARHEMYWGQINLPSRDQNTGAHGTWISANYDFFNVGALAFEVERMVSLRLLAIANVRYLISESALTGPNLQKISGPAEPPRRHDFFADTWAEKLAHYRHRLAKFFDYGAVHVYEIANPFPRAYAPKEVVGVPEGTSGPDFVRQVERLATLERALAHAEDLPAGFTTVPGSLAVTGYREVTDGIEVDVAGQGGIVVVNIAHLPFWHAEADGWELTIVPVNEVQMAVQVPEGVTGVAFHYRRPTVGSVIERAICALMGRQGE